MKTLTPADVRARLRPHHFDKVTIRAGGIVEVREEYFFRRGRTAEEHAADVQKVFPEYVVTGRDDWHPWPRSSYFVATFDLNAPRRGGRRHG